MAIIMLNLILISCSSLKKQNTSNVEFEIYNNFLFAKNNKNKIRHYCDQISNKKDSFEYLLKKGQCAHKDGRYQLAYFYFNKSKSFIKTNIHKFNYLQNMGSLSFSMENELQAEIYFSESLSYGQSDTALYNLMVFYFHNHQFEKSKKLS
jgi:tetratricopeptide (TPR) repeat protein